MTGDDAAEARQQSPGAPMPGPAGPDLDALRASVAELIDIDLDAAGGSGPVGSTVAAGGDDPAGPGTGPADADADADLAQWVSDHHVAALDEANRLLAEALDSVARGH